MKIYPTDKGFYVKGWGYSGIWRYSAEYVARMLDRKFKQEMEEVKKGQEKSDPSDY